MNPDIFKIPEYPKVLKINFTEAERLIVVGDVHGCLDELELLLKKAEPGPKDILVYVGDLVDRGPYSAEVVHYVRAQQKSWLGKVLCLLGNHEEKHIRWRRHETTKRIDPTYKNPMKVARPEFLEIQNKLTDDDIAWMAELPSGIHIDRSFDLPRLPRLITHAGLIEGKVWRQANKALIRNRYIDRTTLHPVKYDIVGTQFVQPPGSVIWDELWPANGARVVYGHIVHGLEKVRVNNNCYGIDTGCCFGGALTIYIEELSTGMVSFKQVKASKTYFEMTDIE